MNALSALTSAFAIMFLFWTITHLVRKVLSVDGVLDARHIPSVIFSGIIGSMAYTFSDTFWFSAVEGELYAMSSLVTGLVFWGMLKWEEEADKPWAGRWIILIAYIMGLGLGIHRLNLLVIPVIVFVYYFRKYEVTRAGLLKTILLSLALLGLIVFVLMPGIPEAAGWFELLFVNVIGLPYNSGLLFYVVLIFAALGYGIWFSLKRKQVLLNYIFTSLLVIMIGYSSYAMIMIRSSARPPMNQNDPSDVFSLSYYINMKQYGSSPKLFGPYYNAPVTGVKRVIAGYNKTDGKYKPYYQPEYTYSKEFETIFPRMWSPDSDHEAAYKYWGQVTGRKYTVGEETVTCPTFSENLRYFFRYQVGYMYLRYFMWNFAGRQNDLQGEGNTINGNWISGIKFIDEARLGDPDKLPDDVKSNAGRNVYFFLPLILGIAGMIWQYRKSNSSFWVVFTFFIMTGVAIILYLNQYPNQPRERDYAYAGSFYAFAIWIGLGFMLVYETLSKYLRGRYASWLTFLILFLSVPLLMASQNWDDHDRSGRYTARDIGANYLKSCAPNSILFTYGDNDSFPVWYVQDVEGIRSDVRVANLSYIQAGWYISMMRQKAFESDPLPLSLPQNKYMEGLRTQLPVNNRIEKPVPIADIVAFAGQDGKEYKIDISGKGDYMNYLPAGKFIIDVDSAKVVANGTVKPYMLNRLVKPMIWEYSSEDAFKGDLTIMDMFSVNKWERPVYYSTTVPSSQYKGLEKYFVQEGLAYRIVPVNTGKPQQGEFGMTDIELMYDNMMNKFSWGRAEAPGVYLDENNRRMFSNYRRIFGLLANALVEKGDNARAVEAARRGLSIVPPAKMPYDYFCVGLAEALIKAGSKDEGLKLLNDIAAYAKGYLEYAVSVPAADRWGLDYVSGINMQAMLDIYNMANKLNLTDLSASIEPDINNYYALLFGTRK